MKSDKLYKTEINNIVNESQNSAFFQFKDLIKSIKEIHREERKKGKVDEVTNVRLGLVEISDLGTYDNFIVVGDLHGDLESLEHILKQDDNSKFIFLGDYGDRGEQSIEVIYTVMKLKTLYPNKFILIRGNHEFPPNMSVSPFDMPKFLKEKYGADWNEGYKILIQFYDSLYHSLIVKNKYVMLHGGVPSEINSINDLALAREKHPEKRYLEDIIWSDPRDIEGVKSSMRGAGKIFGKDVTKDFLELTGAKILIRGHESCNGFKTSHDGLVITVFSRKGLPYNNSKAGFLRLKGETDSHKILENSETL